MIDYLIAKYVDDLARNEPKNVGVIVTDGDRIVARFDGENDYGSIDLRKVRHRISGSHAYRAWTHYWRAVLDDPSAVGAPEATPSELIDRLANEAGRDFYLEHGGTILLDTDEGDLAKTAQRLYEKIVREPDPPAPLSLQDKSRRALAVAGAPMDDGSRFRSQFNVALDIDGVKVEHEVSYKVLNGDWHYLQEMPFDPGRPRVSRKEASHCAFLFEHARWGREHSVILFDGSDLSDSSADLLQMLESFAPVVDVDRTEEAAAILQDNLRLAEH